MSVSYGGDSIVFADGSVNSSGFIGHRNRIINGAMVIDQRNAGAVVTSNDFFPVDRFRLGFGNSSGAFSAQQTTTAPAGFINSIKYLTTTADASLGASEYATLYHAVEGLNVADLAWGTANAATVTLSFWCRSSITGTFGGSIRNGAGNRSYPFSYTINQANTWEKQTITIPGDTTGTWLTTNGVGLYLNFGMGTGTSLSATAGAWTAGNYINVTGAVNLIATLNADFYITGVQLERGSTASSFEYRPYGTELALCQRYYVQSNNAPSGGQFMDVVGRFSGTTQAIYTIYLPVTMRAQPAVSVSPAYNFSGVGGASWYANLAGVANYAWQTAPTTVTSFLLNTACFYVTVATVAGTSVGLWTDPYCPTTAAANYFAITAELV
jgi:hypothetical protein